MLVVSLLPALCFAATLPQELLKDGIGVRPLGMGGAFSAVADDVNALYYNPAGLGATVFQYSMGNLDNDNSKYANSRYDLLNIGNFGYGAVSATNHANESVSANYYGWGYREAHGFSWGFNYKTSSSSLNSGGAQGASGDLGFLLKVTPWLSAALVGVDFAATKNYPTTPSTRVGLALTPLDGRLKLATDIAFDSSRPNENLTFMGAEYYLSENLAIRSGAYKGIPSLGISMGFGVVNVDYAVLNDPSFANGQIQRLGFSIAFKPERKRYMSMVKPKEYLLLDLQGALIGGRSQFSLLGGSKQGADSVLLLMRQAESDPDLDGVILKLGGMDTGLAGMALAEELQSEIRNLQAKGKKVIVYAEGSALGDEYYLASAADKIVVAEGSFVGGLGRLITITRLKGLFDKVGVQWQVMSAGKYKDTFNPYKDKMSADQQEMLEEIVQDNYRQLITTITSNRHLEPATVKEIADGRLISPEEAKELHLIDSIGYLNDAKGDATLVGPGDIMPVESRDFLIDYLNKIAIIEIDGTITTGKSSDNIIFGGRTVGADTIVEQIKHVSEDPSVKALVLRVNSPGGSVIGSSMIYDELVKARKEGKKYVVASMGELAASGGYMVSAAADEIIADPSTLTGAIGVISGDGLPVFQGIYKKLGITVEVVKEGEHADMFAGNRLLTKQERGQLEGLFNDSYRDFVNKVAIGRHMTTFEAGALAEGRVYTGNQAKQVNLVDRLGGFSDAVEEAKKLSGVRGEARLIYYQKVQGFWIENGLQSLIDINNNPTTWLGLTLPLLNQLPATQLNK